MCTRMKMCEVCTVCAVRKMCMRQVIVCVHPNGVQRHHGEWRVSPLGDPESNLRVLKSALALMTECDCRTPGCKTCQDVRYHKGWHFLQRYGTRCGLLRQRNDIWTLARDDHESKRHKSSDDSVPMAQEPSSGSGMKRSNPEAIRRADAEAEKALERAKLQEERRAAKRACATPTDESGICDERREVS